MGKTSLLLSIMLNAAKLGVRVGLLSQEMDWMQILHRFTSLESSVNLQAIRLGRFTKRGVDANGEVTDVFDQAQYAKYVAAQGRLSKLEYPPYVSDARNVTPQKLLAKAARWQSEGGLDLLIVDYLQILSSGGLFKGGDSSGRVAEVGYFARSLKDIARELHVPVITAAQLNRSLENRADKRPQLSDLRESGEIEQESDVVAFIYRDVVYNPDTEFPNKAEIIVGKHRNGPTGTIDLHFERSLTRFSDAKTTKIDLGSL
jgi:replicative DNA helicase